MINNYSEWIYLYNVCYKKVKINLRTGHLLLHGGDRDGPVVEDAGELLQTAGEGGCLRVSIRALEILGHHVLLQVRLLAKTKVVHVVLEKDGLLVHQGGIGEICVSLPPEIASGMNIIFIVTRPTVSRGILIAARPSAPHHHK